MPRGRLKKPNPADELGECKTDDETVMAALMSKIRRNPPTPELVPLVNAWVKVRMVGARIDKADFMSGFDETDDPLTSTIVKPPA
jgi:hypothetical protein